MYRDYREIELNGLICFKNQLGLIYIYIHIHIYTYIHIYIYYLYTLYMFQKNRIMILESVVNL